MNTKTLFSILLVSMLVTINAYAQGKLEVKVHNIKEAKGTVRVGLFNSEDKFLKEAVDGKIIQASEDEVTVVFENLKKGTYALSVYHDENDNGDLDTNVMGIPNEGFAFGNNAMGMFGPPSFDDAKVVIEDNGTAKQIIKLKYF